MAHHQPETWDGHFPLACRIAGDRMFVTPDLVRWRTREYVSADDLERERRLYLRLADLAVKQRDGTVTMRRGWQQKALEFANAYAPPVDYDVVRVAYPAEIEGIPLAHFANEALFLWWVLHLHRQLSERKGKGSLREALKAVVQLRADPAADGHSVTPLVTEVWQRLLSAWDLVPGEKVAPDGTVPPRFKTPREISHEQWFPATSDKVRCLRPKQVKDRVEDLYRNPNYEGDEGKLWQLAHNVFANAVNLRLSGVTLMCLPAPERTTAAPSVGFHFLTPLARIWYGLWEDLAGLRLSWCPRCGRFFIPTRKDKRFCSVRCQNAENVARWRKRQAARLARGGAEKKSSRKKATASRTSRRAR